MIHISTAKTKNNGRINRSLDIYVDHVLIKEPMIFESDATVFFEDSSNLWISSSSLLPFLLTTESWLQRLL